MENWNEWKEKQDEQTLAHLNYISNLIDDNKNLFEYILRNFNYQFYTLTKNANILSKSVFLFLVHNQELYGSFLQSHTETINSIENDNNIDFVEVDEDENELYLYSLEQVIDFFIQDEFELSREEIKTYATIKIE
ncbi:hypothetical protein [Ureaplasma diversum]|uniref:DUF4375 domain-containing protein n=1 Tax=Ureaplasma diversum NCTC 246 TaxID=1188241 RepID=A0A084EZ32_9BACT|nr:hypothetical protein [Ureaplasma diversum]KEZ23224.1 hypothetical protein UDIV_3880 [Ureaplasma diversum NCTC 246]